MMKVLFFGSLSDLAGTSMIEMSAKQDMKSLIEELIARFPALENKTIQYAINKKKIEGNIVLNEGDEIALFHAFAGG